MPGAVGVPTLGYMAVTLLASHVSEHAEAVAANPALPFTVDPWALGAVACCVAILVWWVAVQCASRCASCGYVPLWCKCPVAHPNDHR